VRTTRRFVTLDQFGPPEVMRWTSGPLAPRADDEVLVAVEAIGVNFADTMVRRGEYRRDQPLDFTPGFEVAGRVLEGPAEGPAPGTAVVVFCDNGGGYADTVAAPSDHVFEVLDGIPLRDAATLFTQGTTALYAVHRYGRVQPGEWVLVHAAAGGLGAMTVQLLARLGAKTIAVASTPEKLAVARGHGAVAGVLADPETLAAEVRGLTAGRGADVIIDGVGGDLFGPSMRALAFGGRLVVVGSASQAPAMLDVRALMPRGQTVTGFIVARVAEEDPAEPHTAFAEIQRLFLAGEVRPQVRYLPASELATAHELIESRRLTGKLVLELEPA
jgi:NADPH2:quinone reductase